VRTRVTRLSPGQGWVLALTSMASLMVSLDLQVVATALPVIRLHLHASLAALEWTVNAYTLSFAVLLLTGAALGERLGRGPMLAAGVGMFTIASAACALAPDAGVLVAARALQGAGAALMLPVALALLSAAFPPSRRTWALGVFSGVSGLAVLAGPVVGGAITQGVAWQWIFWLNVPIGLVMIAFILVRIPVSSGAGGGLDLPGLILAAGGTFGIVWALIRANGISWHSPQIILMLGAGVVLSLAFVGWELRATEPMVPMRLFCSRAFAAGNAVAFCVFAVVLAWVFFMAQFMQDGLGYGPLGAGLRLLPGWATLALIAPFAGTLVSRLGERPLVAGGMTVVAAALTWIALIARTGLPYWQLVPPMMLGGIGASVVIPASMSVVMTSAPPAAIGKASGTYNTLRQLGGAFGVAIVAAVFAAHGGYSSPEMFISGFGPAMGACAGLALVGAITGLAVPGRPRPAAASQPAPESAPRASATAGRSEQSLSRTYGGNTPRGTASAAARRVTSPVGQARRPRPCRR
jgi:EmrB/QacA subfamily drug resistance transporter